MKIIIRLSIYFVWNAVLTYIQLFADILNYLKISSNEQLMNFKKISSNDLKISSNKDIFK